MSRTLSSKYYELCHIHITNRSKWSIELCGSRHAECLGPLTVGFDILKRFYSAKSSVLSNFEEFVLSNFEEFVLSNFEEFVLSNSAEFDILSDSTEFDSSFDRMSWLRCRFLFLFFFVIFSSEYHEQTFVRQHSTCTCTCTCTCTRLAHLVLRHDSFSCMSSDSRFVRGTVDSFVAQ